MKPHGGRMQPPWNTPNGSDTTPLTPRSPLASPRGASPRGVGIEFSGTIFCLCHDHHTCGTGTHHMRDVAGAGASGATIVATTVAMDSLTSAQQAAFNSVFHQLAAQV